jgi:hypothetical protein
MPEEVLFLSWTCSFRYFSNSLFFKYGGSAMGISEAAVRLLDLLDIILR